jgi:repressor of nif and glnA expression
MAEMNRTMVSILKVLDAHPEEIIGSRELSRQLKLHGVELTERTVRYHLKIMDERGLTQVFGKEGRKITEKGREELQNSLVSDRVGFIISKIENLSFRTAFDVDSTTGNLVLNISTFPAGAFKEAVRTMKPVFDSSYIMSDKVTMAPEGENIGEFIVPEGMVGMGTICSVTINGIFLKAGIPVTSRFGGLLQVEDSDPSRFVALISYEGSSLDPHLVFIKSRMTDVAHAVKGGHGKVLASFREIPMACTERALEIQEKLRAIGIGGVLLIGPPNQPLLEMPVGMDRAGMVLVGGLNPIAAVEETGIMTESAAMSVMFDYEKLMPFKEAVAELKV